MKKGILILLGMFMMVSTVEAKKGDNLPNRIRVNYSYNNAVNFIERGVEFYIFTNGDFDFDTNFNNRYNRNNSIRINRDYRGRIRNVGNVFINYDRRGNVTRIGNVFIKYYRGQLSKVGDLRVRYNRNGYPFFYGNVKEYYYDNGIRFNINFGDVCDFNDRYFYRNDFRNNYSQFREDNNFYYYKAKPNAKIGKRSTILKRRKPVNKTDRRKTIKRNSSNSYRKQTTTDSNLRIDTRRNSTFKKTDKRNRITNNSKIKRNNRIEKDTKKTRALNTKKTSKKEPINRKRRR
ncbi:hypothetical protein [Polaribacter ponticola]|uniref:Uncharacterized protein n=1 Tax=Polaribacter ponticola TaxID=2978475 RepID=A0ABT5S8R1_9FLAO|nr:hypothetical protein [Polaribacter sp. MSW5]MDD7914504.1 hypothetical protein [Polaribacter sp. MSW5]